MKSCVLACNGNFSGLSRLRRTARSARRGRNALPSKGLIRKPTHPSPRETYRPYRRPTREPGSKEHSPSVAPTSPTSPLTRQPRPGQPGAPARSPGRLPSCDERSEWAFGSSASRVFVYSYVSGSYPPVRKDGASINGYHAERVGQDQV